MNQISVSITEYLASVWNTNDNYSGIKQNDSFWICFVLEMAL